MIPGRKDDPGTHTKKGLNAENLIKKLGFIHVLKGGSSLHELVIVGGRVGRDFTHDRGNLYFDFNISLFREADSAFYVISSFAPLCKQVDRTYFKGICQLTQRVFVPATCPV